MERLIYHTSRDRYSVGQIRSTMTVGELISILENYDKDTPIYLSFDKGYTYGGINERCFEEFYEEDNNE